MTIATYLSENKVAVIATTIGGVVVTASFVLYAKNELKRRQDQVVLEQQLSSLRRDLLELRSDVSMVRAIIKQLVGNKKDFQPLLRRVSSDPNLRASAGIGDVQVTFQTQMEAISTRHDSIPIPPPLTGRNGSMSTLSSDDDYLDALESLEIAPSRSINTDEKITEMFVRADECFEKPDHQRVIYCELKEIYDVDDTMRYNVDVLWRLTRSCHAVGNTYEAKDQKRKEILLEGREYALQAYSIDENNFNVLKWTAVVVGSLTDHLGTQEKIEQGYLFKEYLDRAIAIQPKDTTLLHMRGRFAYSVANLSWLERKAATMLYSKPPEATVDEALEDFLEVEELEPSSWIENLYYLVQCLLIKKNKQEAVKYMKNALQITPVDDSESRMLADIRRLLSRHS